MGKLDGKTALITGASRGIGRGIAQLFAAEGARVACAARTLHEGDHQFPGSLDSTVAAIRADGGEAVAIAANIADYEECRRLVAETEAALGPVDILVNNAALRYTLPIAEFPINRWQRSWDVTFNAPFYLSQLVLPGMLARRAGAIVNISSEAARGPGSAPYHPEEWRDRNGTAYGAAKAALERFTQGLASEVYEQNVSVTALSPSEMVPTEGNVHFGFAESLDDPRGEPVAWMAQACLILATEPCEAITGKVTYSQQLLQEHGLLPKVVGNAMGINRPGSGYSQI